MKQFSIETIAGRFETQGRVTECVPFGSGHIHDTYRVAMDDGGRYLLQRINHDVFRDVEGLMHNFDRVTRHIRKKLAETAGHDPDRECLTLIPAKDGRSFLQGEDGRFWRMLLFIQDSRSVDQSDDPALVAEAGRAYGGFIRLLSDLPGRRLNETIPAFHNMQNRLRNFFRAVQNDPAGRVQDVQSEIRWIDRRADEMQTIQRMVRDGRIPERITHNDTKINNVLFNAPGRALCVVDLDTVMPGCVHFDFGDAIRTCANTGAEDEPDPDNVSISLRLFEAFAKGFLEKTGDLLTPPEMETLASSARMMTFIIGIRFMTDYLEGDRYYKIHHPNHNLQRARAQFRLVESMEEHRMDMEEIVIAAAG
jgi:Ser/Thr protein kinase RdoA (MazF antagonist)